MSISCIITSAGLGKRMGKGVAKQYRFVNDAPIIIQTLQRFLQVKTIQHIVLVVNKSKMSYVRKLLVDYSIQGDVQVVAGGATRSLSVYEGIKVLPEKCDVVLVHDGVRPFVSMKLITTIIQNTKKYGACVPGLASTQTVKQVNTKGFVCATVDRDSIYQIQTPQGFKKNILEDAYNKNKKKLSSSITDDSMLVEMMNKKVKIVEGELSNIKITHPSDLSATTSEVGSQQVQFRTGMGYDFHKMQKGRKCILGGVEIPFEKGPLGHSDADVVLHAICDALLGAVGLGDIGDHFPDTDAKYKNIDSCILLEKVVKLVSLQGYKTQNCDVTIVLEKPKLKEYKALMKKKIATLLGVELSCVNIKATTMEGTSVYAQSNAIATYAVIMVNQSM